MWFHFRRTIVLQSKRWDSAWSDPDESHWNEI